MTYKTLHRFATTSLVVFLVSFIRRFKVLPLIPEPNQYLLFLNASAKSLNQVIDELPNQHILHAIAALINRFGNV